MFLYTCGCNWMTTALLSFVACISLCSIFSELWSLGFYICTYSGGFNLLESDFEFVKPQLKNMTIGMSLGCNGNASTHRKFIQKIENVERQILADHDLNNTEKSRTTKTVGDRLLELEDSFRALAKVLEFEKEKSAQDQITFMKTLSDLHSFHDNKQSNLEAIIADLQRELQVEKLRTSEQTHFIQTLTLASSEATVRAELLQLKLSDIIDTEVNKSKMPCGKDLLEPQALDLKNEELQRIQIVSLSNLKLLEGCNRLKVDLLETKSQLEQALHDNQLLLCKIELSKPNVERTDS